MKCFFDRRINYERRRTYLSVSAFLLLELIIRYVNTISTFTGHRIHQCSKCERFVDIGLVSKVRLSRRSDHPETVWHRSLDQLRGETIDLAGHRQPIERSRRKCRYENEREIDHRILIVSIERHVHGTGCSHPTCHRR